MTINDRNRSVLSRGSGTRRHPRAWTAIIGAAILTGLSGLLAAAPAAAGPAAPDGDLNATGASSRVPAAAAAAPVTDSRFAVVAEAGSLVRSRNAVSALRFGALGAYEVVFDRDVSGCGYLAAIGSAGTGTPGAGYVAVAQRFGNPNAVFVVTYATDGVLSKPQAFHLEVVC